MQLKRRFLTIGNRRVHYFRAGDGPPAVLIHSSPANARLLMKEIERLSNQFTVFAFDTPGFGLSDPLPKPKLDVADLADALAETLAAIGMPACPVFGTHTGAAIALELGSRHPEVTTGMVLDGVPIFTSEECDTFFFDYFRELPLSDLGRQYSEAWTRFRDQSIWFPWTMRKPGQLNPYDLGPPHSTHLWVSMFFEAAEHYAPAYRAASFYGSRALRAIEVLSVPAIFCAASTDMLHSHLERMPPLKGDQAIVDIGSSYERKRELIAASFSRFGAEGAAPADAIQLDHDRPIGRQFIDGRHGQIHFRYAGDRAAPALLLVHDAPGSAEQIEPLIEILARDHFVVAPDLPGHGESDAPPEQPSLADYAQDLAALLDELGLHAVTVRGVGFGSSAALAFACFHADRTTALELCALVLPSPEERAELQEKFAPAIEIEPDGAHWYRTWLMLRDAKVYFPWYDRRVAAARRVAADFSARPLHRHVMDVMRARATYGQLITAALAADAGLMLSDLEVPLTIITGSQSPLAAYDERLMALTPQARRRIAEPSTMETREIESIASEVYGT